MALLQRRLTGLLWHALAHLRKRLCSSRGTQAHKHTYVRDTVQDIMNPGVMWPSTPSNTQCPVLGTCIQILPRPTRARQCRPSWDLLELKGKRCEADVRLSTKDTMYMYIRSWTKPIDTIWLPLQQGRQTEPDFSQRFSKQGQKTVVSTSTWDSSCTVLGSTEQHSGCEFCHLFPYQIFEKQEQAKKRKWM